MSNPKFAAALRALWVDPPMKISNRTGKETFAFAKSDKEFTALLEHEDPAVQALVAARLGVKSTIAETRALRLLNTARRGRGFPVMLNYWGAKTTGRHSGGNGINPQNIPARGRGSEIRKALIAPPGHLVVVGDSANIELRVAMACAGQRDAVEKLRTGTDLYCDFASAIYQREITKADKPERFLGKVAMLSLQYGAGAAKFREIVRLMAQQSITDYEAENIVSLYRNRHSSVRKLWWHCDNVILTAIANGEDFKSVDVNDWFITVDRGFAHPGLPGVVYNNLRKEGESWVYGDKQYIYGGKMVENLCQHMARHVVMWQTACVNDRYPVALSVHDEIVCVVPEKEADDCAAYMEQVLNTAPKWCRDKLPVSSEVHIGRSYGEAK
jgi:DNA polymerase